MTSIEQDDMFNIPDNDEQMLDGNDEDEGNNLNSEYNNMEDDEIELDQDQEQEQEQEQDEDDDDEEDDDDQDDQDDEDDDDDEMNGEDEDDDEEQEEDDDDAKFMDAQENQDEQTEETEETEETTENGAQDSNNTNQPHIKGEDNETLSNLSFREQCTTKARIATQFDTTPSVAFPYTSQVHALAFTEGPKWILTGGEDGFIRKYDFISSIEGKAPLTMAQKHNLVDSVTKAGVISSYWENEQPVSKKELMASNPKLKMSDFSTGSVTYEPKVNPVYALDAERNGYWCLSGLLSGGISLYTMRYNEGAIHHYFHHGSKNDNTNGHNDAVSVIRLNTEQDKFLSGSWDKSIRQWDLNTGKTTTRFEGCTGQISNIQYRPLGLTDLTLDFSDDSDPQPLSEPKEEEDIDSLFGDSDEDPNDAERKSDETRDKPQPKTSTNPSKASNRTFKNENVFMSSTINGTINIWDARTPKAVLKLGVSEGIPPWCMSSTWSNSGDLIYAGRRNSTVEEFSIRMPHKRAVLGSSKSTMVPNVLKLLQFPKISGPVSALSTMPNDDFLLCGSNDNIRLYNLNLYDNLALGTTANPKNQATPFLIIPGHHGGILSNLHVDDTGRFMVSASGNRGWGHTNHTDAILVYEIDFEG